MLRTYIDVPMAPQPGDGEWLLHKAGKRRHRRKKPKQSFLNRNAENDGEEFGYPGGPFQDVGEPKTFLLPFHNAHTGKEQTPRPDVQRATLGFAKSTIAQNGLLSTPSQAGTPQSQPPLPTFLRNPVHATHIFQPADPSTPNREGGPGVENFNTATPNKMAEGTVALSGQSKTLPPHLRPKSTKDASATKLPNASAQVATPVVNGAHQKTMLIPRPVQNRLNPKPANGAASAHGSTNRKPTSGSTASSKGHTEALRKMLAERHGVKVSEPKPANALVSYPSSEEGNKVSPTESKPAEKSTNGDFKAAPHRHNNRRGRSRGRGGANAANGGNGHPAQQSQWPTGKEQRHEIEMWNGNAKTKELDTGWANPWPHQTYEDSDSIDSMAADSGWGRGKSKKRTTNSEDWALADWSGNFAPAPIDWDSRPAFREGQSVRKIERWMDRIDEEMVGKDWEIPMIDIQAEGITLHFAPSPKDKQKAIVGDAAPRYWIPIVIDKVAPQTFWNELMRSQEPKPVDDGDLDDVKPWWELYQTPDCSILKHYQPPYIKGIDPDESEVERLARESDFGGHRRMENKARFQKAKKAAELKRKQKAEERARQYYETHPDAEPVEKIKPDLKLYIRSAKPADMHRIKEIYNYYVDNTVCTPETTRRTSDDISQRYNAIRSNKLPFLVACERGEKLTARGRGRRRNDGEDIILPDKIVGFATADDFNDMQGMYRFTAEIEVFVDCDKYMKGVAKCLLDKLMALLDPNYIERGGYDVEGADMEGVGPSRVIQNLIVNFPYDSPERYEWVGRWLKTWLQFEEVGHLRGIGNKEGKRYVSP